MLLLRGALGVLLFAVWVYALIDVITTDESRCRNLKKTWWVLIVLFFFDIGSIAWFVAGRPVGGRTSDLPYKGNRGNTFPEYERPGRFAATADDDDEEFLRRCRERADEQRRRHKEQQQRDADET